MDGPKISVVTVCLNSVCFIERAILSVLSQTYKNIEYIIIDGGSSDGTLDIINKYKDKLSKIVSEKDNGIFDAINKGIKISTGEIIYILNSDDYLFDDYVFEDVIKEFFKNNDIDFIFGKASVESGSAAVSFVIPSGKISKKSDFLKDGICHQAVFVKRKLFYKFGFFDQRYKICADLNWFLRIFSYSENHIRYLDRFVVYYYPRGFSYKNRSIFNFERMKLVIKNYSIIDIIRYFYFVFKSEAFPKIISKIHYLKIKKIMLFSLRMAAMPFKALYYINQPAFLFNLIKAKIFGLSPFLKYLPPTLTLWVTDRCNLKCNFCLKNKPDIDYRHKLLPDMTFNTFKKIMQMFSHARNISFIGQGEPLLNNNIFRMFEYLARKGKRINLVTNGVLIDSAMARKIMSYNLEAVRVSLKAASGEDYEAITACPSEYYNRVIDGIKYLVEAKVILRKNTKVIIQYVIIRSKVNEMKAVVDIGDFLGIDRVDFLNYIPFGIFNEEGARESLFSDDNEVLDIINEIKAKPHKVSIGWPPLLLRKDYPGLCYSLFCNLGIDSLGNVGMCDRVVPPDEKYGNIFKDKNIWNSKLFVEAREKNLFNKENLPPRCKYCVDMSNRFHFYA